MEYDMTVYVVDFIGQLVDKASSYYTLWYNSQHPDNPVKRKPLYFYADSLTSMNGQLALKETTNTGAYSKYPAIMMFCDFVETRLSRYPYEVEVKPQFLIVDNSLKTGSADIRREKVYKPVLYPIYNNFIKAIMTDSNIYDYGEDCFLHKKIDRIRVGASLNRIQKEQGKKALLPDYLDGIEISDLKLKIKKICIN